MRRSIGAGEAQTKQNTQTAITNKQKLKKQKKWHKHTNLTNHKSKAHKQSTQAKHTSKAHKQSTQAKHASKVHKNKTTYNNER